MIGRNHFVCADCKHMFYTRGYGNLIRRPLRVVGGRPFRIEQGW